MSQCLKTGARVYLTEYAETFAADIHEIAECFIINYNPVSSGYWDENDATHRLTIGTGYMNSKKGIIVIPKDKLKVIQKGE